MTGGPCPHSKGLRVYPEGQGLGLQEGQCQDLTGLAAHPGLYVQSWGSHSARAGSPLAGCCSKRVSRDSSRAGVSEERDSLGHMVPCR